MWQMLKWNRKIFLEQIHPLIWKHQKCKKPLFLSLHWILIHLTLFIVLSYTPVFLAQWLYFYENRLIYYSLTKGPLKSLIISWHICTSWKYKILNLSWPMNSKILLLQRAIWGLLALTFRPFALLKKEWRKACKKEEKLTQVKVTFLQMQKRKEMWLTSQSYSFSSEKKKTCNVEK